MLTSLDTRTLLNIGVQALSCNQKDCDSQLRTKFHGQLLDRYFGSFSGELRTLEDIYPSRTYTPPKPQGPSRPQKSWGIFRDNNEILLTELLRKFSGPLRELFGRLESNFLRITLLNLSIPLLREKGIAEPALQAQARIALSILDHNGSYFFQKIVVDNFGKLVPPEAAVEAGMFTKTGSHLIPFMGFGMGMMVRVISSESFAAWVKAEEYGIPTEIILRHNDGSRAAIMMENGAAAVLSVFSGEPVLSFCRRDPNSIPTLRSLRASLRRELSQIGVVHGHPHSSNMVVDSSSGRARIRLIDWDAASQSAA